MRKNINTYLVFIVALILLAFDTTASDIENFVSACTNNTDMGEEICECSANKAQHELSPLGFDFVVAAMHQNDNLTTQLRSQMAPNEIITAATFMLDGPTRCAEELNPE